MKPRFNCLISGTTYICSTAVSQKKIIDPNGFWKAIKTKKKTQNMYENTLRLLFDKENNNYNR